VLEAVAVVDFSTFQRFSQLLTMVRLPCYALGLDEMTPIAVLGHRIDYA
jgi:hypothetical protein